MNIESYRRWFNYERDSNVKVLNSLQAASDSARSHPQFQRAVDLMAHLVAARNMWLFRLGSAAKPTELFPTDTSLTELPQLIAQMESAWASYLENLTDEKIARTFDYRSYEGEPFRNTIEDVLTQLYGHSLYHRGQIAMILRSIGAEPAPTDFIYWTREALPDA